GHRRSFPILSRLSSFRFGGLRHRLLQILLLAGAAEVELELHVHVAHQFLLAHVLRLLDQPGDFLLVALEQIFAADLHLVVRGDDLNLDGISELAFLERLTATVAEVSDGRTRRHGVLELWSGGVMGFNGMEFWIAVLHYSTTPTLRS